MIGKQFGDYRIEAHLGEGGMGEVWRAVDVKLRRPAALKLLSTALAADPEFIARFRREAELAAALSHPNIATVYAAGSQDGRHYLAMEFIPGETLAQRMKQGRMSAAEACGLIAQLADGLAAAHAKGLVHRDVKPPNLMVQPDGRLKILDFGLAKPEASVYAQSPATPGSGSRPDLALTAQGTILGTVSFLSPEQARGEPLDRRSDIFCAGLVLYELLHGRPPFRGGSPAETLGNLLHVNPAMPPLDLPLTGDGGLVRILEKCLAKLPAERYQHADELALDLRAVRRRLKDAGGADSSVLTHPATLSTGTGGRPATAAARVPARLLSAVHLTARRKWAAGLICAGLLSLAAWAGFRLGSRRMAAGFKTPDISLLTRDASIKESAVLSPDGRLLAFNSDRTGLYKIFVRTLGGPEIVQITRGNDADVAPVFSPDGTRLAFARRRAADSHYEIRLVPALGGESRLLFEDPQATVLRDFFPDGKALLVSRCPAVSTGNKGGGLFRLPTEGGAPQLLLALPGPDCIALSAAAVSPDASRLHYQLKRPAAEGGGLYESRLSGGKAAAGRLLHASGNHFDSRLAYGAGGRRLYFSASNLDGNFSNLYALDLASKRLQAVTNEASLIQFPSTDHSGRRLVYTLWNESNTLGLFDLTRKRPADGSGLTRLTRGPLDDEQPAFSPDGRRAVFVSDADGEYNLWLADLSSGSLRQLTFGGDHNYSPFFSKDGREVYYYSNRGGAPGLYVMPAEGGQSRQIVAGLNLESYVTRAATPSLAPDGKSILHGVRTAAGIYQVERLFLDDGRRVPVGQAAGRAPVFSADGDSFFAISRRGTIDKQPGKMALWRYDLEGRAQRLYEFPVTVIERYLAASRDGRHLYFLAEIPAGGHNWQVWRLELSSLKMEPVTNFQEAPPRFGFAISPDGGKLLASINQVLSNVVLLDGME